MDVYELIQERNDHWKKRYDFRWIAVTLIIVIGSFSILGVNRCISDQKTTKTLSAGSKGK